MVKIEDIHVYGIREALKGMRNPMNSWAKSDTSEANGTVDIGDNDMQLCKTLIKAGAPHRKFLRQIFVSMDVTLSVYVVQELDTYKVGTTRNSCSFMHKGTAKMFEASDFTFEIDPIAYDKETSIKASNILASVLDALNFFRQKYLETKDMKYFRLIRQLLPMGYNVKFTWTGNYEVLLNMYYWRQNHRLQEWRDFCKVIYEKLPYFKDFADAAYSKEQLESAK